MGDQFDLRIMVESARVLCNFDTSDDFEAENFLLDEDARRNLANAAKDLVGGFICAEVDHRREFGLATGRRPSAVCVPFRTLVVPPANLGRSLWRSTRRS